MYMDRPRLLVLLRHGESARNKVKEGVVYFPDDESRAGIRGVPDYKIPLTEEGIKQAEIVGKTLKEKFGVFDYAYHSGYLRTIQTLEGALKIYDDRERSQIKVRKNAFIRERDPGYTYDMTQEEAEAAFPWLKEYWDTFGGFFACPPGGESLAGVAERVYLFLNMLFRDRAGKNILITTHGGTIRSFRFLLEKWDYDKAISWTPSERPTNCSLTVYEYANIEGRLLFKEYIPLEADI